MIIARSDHPVGKALRKKISLFCDVEERAVVPMVTCDNIYQIPITLEEETVGNYVMESLDLEEKKTPNWKLWKEMLQKMEREKLPVKIALVGKYVELHDAYLSVREALDHAGIHVGVEIEIDWIHSSTLEKPGKIELLKEADGILVPGGFGERGTEGKIIAIQYAREQNIPYFGLCLGMQLMVVEFAREVLGDEEVNSSEFNRKTPHPVIALMPDQHDITDMGGTMRLGLYPCQLQPNTIAEEAYEKKIVHERHRHRFEFNNDYREILSEAGLQYSGLSPDNRLVEIAELEDHPFMLGTQFHPEFLSRPYRPHPLFVAFIEAVKEYAENKP
jgi:CTP synthase